MRDKNKKIKALEHPLIDFNSLIDIKNYRDLQAFLQNLQLRKKSLADNEEQARSEAIRLQLISRTRSLENKTEEAVVLGLCSDLYSAFENKTYQAKFDELIAICQAKNNVSNQGVMSPTSGSPGRSTPNGSPTASKPKSPSPKGSPTRFFNEGRTKSPVNTLPSPKRSATPVRGKASSPVDRAEPSYITKLEFLALGFSGVSINEKLITLDDRQVSNSCNKKDSSGWLNLIKTEYDKLRANAGMPFFCCRIFQGADFFERALEFAQKKYSQQIGVKKQFTEAEELWIVLKYAEANPEKRTAQAVKNIINDIFQDEKKQYVPPSA